MKRLIFKLLSVVLLLYGLFYVDSYHPFTVVPFCLLISLIVMPFVAMKDDWEAHTLLVCIIFWVTSGFYFYTGFHTVRLGSNHFALVPPFYPVFGEVIAVGEKVDTLHNVAKGFISDAGEVSVERSTFYVLQLDNESTLLFSRTQIILKRGRHLLFEPRYYKYDWILTSTFLDENNIRHTIDLLGHEITKGYFPNIKTIPATTPD